MGRKPSWSSEQLTFLNGYIQEYLKINKGSKVYEPFWVKIRREYNTTFPTLEKLFPGREEGDLTKEELEECGKYKFALHSRIYSFYRWEASKAKKELQSIKKPDGVTQKARKRLYKPAEVYSKMFFKRRLKTLYETEKNTLGLSNRKALGLKTRIAREEFAKEDPETVKKVLERMGKENDKLLGLKPADPRPGDYQRAINEIPSYLRSVLGPLAKNTGYSFTVLMGGPTPVNGGKVTTASFHELAGGVKLTFAESKADYEACVVKPFSKYLKAEYDTATCEHRTLTSEEALEMEESDRWSETDDEDDSDDSDDDDDNEEEAEDKGGVDVGTTSKKAQPIKPTKVAKLEQAKLIALDKTFRVPSPSPPPPPPPSPPLPPSSSPPPPLPSSNDPSSASPTTPQATSNLGQSRPKPKPKGSGPTCRDIIKAVISAPSPNIPASDTGAPDQPVTSASHTAAISVQPSAPHPPNSLGSIAIGNDVATRNGPPDQPHVAGDSCPPNNGVLLSSRTANTSILVPPPFPQPTFLNFDGLPDDAFASPSKHQHNNHTYDKLNGSWDQMLDPYRFASTDPLLQNVDSFNDKLNGFPLGFNVTGTGHYTQSSLTNPQFTFDNADSALTNGNVGMATGTGPVPVPPLNGPMFPPGHQVTEVPEPLVHGSPPLPQYEVNLTPHSLPNVTATPSPDTPPSLPGSTPATNTAPLATVNQDALTTTTLPANAQPTVTSQVSSSDVPAVTATTTAPATSSAPVNNDTDANPANFNDAVLTTAPAGNVPAAVIQPTDLASTAPAKSTNDDINTDATTQGNTEDRPKRAKKASTRNEKMDMIGSTLPPPIPPPSPDLDDISEWATITKDYLLQQSLGDSWMTVVTAWFELEALLGYGSMSGAKMGLPATSRPSEWAKWTSKTRNGGGRNLLAPPAIQDPTDIGLAITQWWNTLQPSFRQSQSGLPLPTLTPPSGAKDPWTSVCRAGPNGLVSVVLLLAWWGLSLPSRSRFQEDSSQLWTNMVNDVTKVLVVLKDSGTHLVNSKKRKRSDDDTDTSAKKPRQDGSSDSVTSGVGT